MASFLILGSSGCLSENQGDQPTRRITSADLATLGSDGILQLDLSEGDVRIDNHDGLFDLDRVHLIDGNASHSASEVVARRFDRKDWNNDFSFVGTIDGIQTDIFLNNYGWFQNSSSNDSTWWKSPEVSCTGGRYMLGMGANTSSLSDILFRGMLVHNSSGVPYKNETAYHEDSSGNPNSWQVTAWASCASAPTGLTVVHVDSANNTTTSKSATATCPFVPGSTTQRKVLLGAGGTIVGADGRVKMDAIVPSTHQAYARASRNADASSSSWYVRAYAICADSLAGLEINHVQVAAGAASTSAVCSSGKVLLSVGGEVSSTPAANIGLGALIPGTGYTPPLGQAVFAYYGALNPGGTVHAYSVCANP